MASSWLVNSKRSPETFLKVHSPVAASEVLRQQRFNMAAFCAIVAFVS